jgi:hypothetical protein
MPRHPSNATGSCRLGARSVLARGVCLLLALICGSATLRAHQSGDGYLLIVLTNGALHGQIELGLRELDTALGLDDDGNGVISRAELKEHRGELVAYVRTNVSLQLDGGSIAIAPHDMRVEERLGVPFLVWRFQSPFTRLPGTLDADYHCLFEVDALHRAFAKVEWDGRVGTGMFSPAVTRQHWDLSPAGSGPSVGQTGLRTFIRDGVWHIWTGYDHMLFLLALLLPAVVERSGGRWVAVPRLRPALWRVLQTVTAFTVAHSLTLSLAALGVIHASPRIVELLIALSVGIAALNNLKPVLHERGWIVAFAFGLIHGFGFAGALQEMNLAGQSLAWPLLGFNLGVELGQAAIVVPFVPLAFRLRHTRAYRIGALQLGSGLILLLASAWFVERLSTPS